MAQKTLKDKEINWRDVFQQCDTSGDGSISIQELRDFCNDEEVIAMFMDIDGVDGDKKITLQEFLSEMSKPSLQECFNQFDTDNSGYLSKDEIREMFRGEGYDGPEDEEKLSAILDHLDENDDGKVCYTELHQKLYE